MDNNGFEDRKTFFDSFLTECFPTDVPNNETSTQFNLFDDGNNSGFFNDNFFFEVSQPPSTIAPLGSVDTPYGPIEEEYDENEAATLCPPPSQTVAPTAQVNQRNYANTFKKPIQMLPVRTSARMSLTQPVPSRAPMMSQNRTNQASTQPINGNISLRQITEIPSKYRRVFTAYRHFNPIQSAVFDQVFYSDTSLAVTAPVGSGKTVIFELAIIRLLHRSSHQSNVKGDTSMKVVYLAPLKILCEERINDWQTKFGELGIKCCEVTEDTDEDSEDLNKATILLTTPEKWDFLTRVRSMAKSVKLVLIDGVHCLNDNERGATIEAVVSRMKMKEIVEDTESDPIRFIAVSSILPNPEDIAEWLGNRENGGAFFKLEEDLRTIKREVVVRGYYCPDAWNNYRFDVELSSKLLQVIKQYYDGKTTLVFTPTKKSAQATAELLAKEASFVHGSDHRKCLTSIATEIKDKKLRQYIVRGVAFHHSTLDYYDRLLVEDGFKAGNIIVLVSTTTFALSVNLRGYLVVVKSTFQHVAGNDVECSETQILQMIGRAGRPQCDKSAVAVILTKSQFELKYKKLISGKQTIESALHKHVAEHFHIEIVLGTIKYHQMAMEWIRSTYLYVRIFKNPKHYGLDPQWPPERIENKIQEWCTKELNGLKRYGLITMDEDGSKVNATAIGRLVAKYFIKLETVKKIASLKGHETMSDLLQLVASSQDLLAETSLRVHEKKHLNAMNSRDKNQPEKETIRFPLDGYIRNPAMKINCLIQAAFGCLPVPDPSLLADITKILKTGSRVAKYMSEYLQLRTKPQNSVAVEGFRKTPFSLLVNAIVLAKCFRARSWENTVYVTRQFDKIGIPVARAIADGGLTSLASIEQSDPGTIEMFANRQPPFGNQLYQNVKKLPRYSLKLDQLDESHFGESSNLQITVTIENFAYLSSFESPNINHGFHVVIGTQNDEILFTQKVSDSILMGWQGKWSCNFLIEGGDRGRKKITCHLISDTYIDIDVTKDFVMQSGKLQETQDCLNFTHPDLSNRSVSPANSLVSNEYCRTKTGESLSGTPNAKRFKGDPATPSVIPGRATLNTETSGVSSYSRPLDLWANVRKKTPPSATVSKPPPDNNEDDAELDRLLSLLPSGFLSASPSDGPERLQEPQRQHQEPTATENGSGDGFFVDFMSFLHTPDRNNVPNISFDGIFGPPEDGQANGGNDFSKEVDELLRELMSGK